MEEETKFEAKESVKLIKNAKGDYQWEIKLLPIGMMMTHEDLMRLEAFNKSLEKSYSCKGVVEHDK